MAGDGPCKGKIAYPSPVAALSAMLRINREMAHQAAREGGSLRLLRGMYGCGDHVHLTSQPGDQEMMSRAIGEFLEQAVCVLRADRTLDDGGEAHDRGTERDGCRRSG